MIAAPDFEPLLLEFHKKTFAGTADTRKDPRAFSNLVLVSRRIAFSIALYCLISCDNKRKRKIV